MSDIVKKDSMNPIEKFKGDLVKRESDYADAMAGNAELAAKFRCAALNAAIANPKLLECDPASLFLALRNCAQLGLEPDPNLGRVYLIPRWNKKLNRNICQAQIGYRGFIELAGRTNKFSACEAQVVREGDSFDYEFGTNGFCRHRPKHDLKAKYTHVWAVARMMKNEQPIFDVMTIAEVEAVRDKFSESAKSGFSPWTNHFESMAKKTVIRRMLKLIPISTELSKAITIDESAEIREPEEATGAPEVLRNALAAKNLPEPTDDALAFDEAHLPKE